MIIFKQYHLRLRTTNNRIPSLLPDSSWWEDSIIFLEKLSNSWSIIPLPKCWAKIPSKPALRYIAHSFPLIGPTSFDLEFTNSILSMVKHSFLSTSSVICSGEARWIGKLKESTWASLINPCIQHWQFWHYLLNSIRVCL